MDIFSLSIRTKPVNGKFVPVCCVFQNKETCKVFRGRKCLQNFFTFIFSEKGYVTCLFKKINYIFCYDLTIDGLLLLSNVDANKIQHDGSFFNGNIFCLTFKNEKVLFNFKSLKCYYPDSLTNAVTKFCIEISPKNKTRLNVVADAIDEAEKIYKVAQLYNCFLIKHLKFWLETTNTISAVAWALFKEAYNNLKINLKMSSEDDFLLRKAYYGGNCQIFGNPNNGEFLRHFDFKSMYGSCMVEIFNFGDFVVVPNPSKIEKNGFFFIHYWSDLYAPVLPHYSTINKKLLFTNGFGFGLFWWEEIELFQKLGGKILDIKYQIKYSEEGRIFENFTKNFSNLREVGPIENFFGKTLINAFYGRLGVSPNSFKTKIFNAAEYAQFQKKNESLILTEIEANELILVKFSKPEDKTVLSNVGLAAMITSKARIKLYSGFLEVFKNNGRLLYCDTDSIFAAFPEEVTQRGFKLISWDFSKKNTKIKEALFALPKAYALKYQDDEERVVIKGMYQNSFSYAEFKNHFLNDESLRGDENKIKNSNYRGSFRGLIRTVNLKKYEKRVFLKNFTRTAPIWRNKNGVYSAAETDEDFMEFLEYLNNNGIEHPFKTSFNIFAYYKVPKELDEAKRLIYGVYVEIKVNSIALMFSKKIIFESCALLHFLINKLNFEIPEAVAHTHTSIYLYVTNNQHNIITVRSLIPEPASRINQYQFSQIDPKTFPKEL